jgi:hypothetical protein
MSSERADVPVAERSPSPTAPTLQYDTRPSGISRRQMSYFLLLLTVNTLLFAGFICMPHVSPMFKDWWADYQKRRDQEKQTAAAAAKVQAALKDCLAYSAPADQVVYAESPVHVTKLLTAVGRTRSLPAEPRMTAANGTGYSISESRSLLANTQWQPPAMLQRADAFTNWLATQPEKVRRMFANDSATVFLGEMKTPAGQRRLVYVSLDAEQSILFYNPQADQRISRYDLETRRMIRVAVFDPVKAGAPVQTALVVHERPEDKTPIPPLPEDAAKETARTVRLKVAWRVFAGQLDPADASRLIIRYDIDGKPGVIDGRLNDGDRLMLLPRAGKLLSWISAVEYLWDFAASPATAPSLNTAVDR